MATPSNNPFFVTGGNLPPDAASYIQRAADDDLYNSLKASHLCYVLTSRQMGKSSLFSRVTWRLRQENYKISFFELSAIGINVSVEQWYDGMLERIGDDLGLDEQIDAFRDANPRLGPQQMWLEVLRRVVLRELSGPVIIIVDEIDIVRSLPFSTDEFFAGIRELHNRQSTEPELRRLTFCLLGVASPGDLIRDKLLTPFNIGRRIELLDFSEEESLHLARGITHVEPGVAEQLVRRVHELTGGQPYLTQRLCREVAERSDVKARGDVDRVCDELFFSLKARETEPNLTFIRDRLLRDQGHLAEVLDLYRQILKGVAVPDEEVNPAAVKLKLAGLVRGMNGFLQIKNLIYRRTFDLTWVRANYPVDWRKRILTATRVTAVVFLFCCLPLAVWAWYQQIEATNQAHQAKLAQEKAVSEEAKAQESAKEASKQKQKAQHYLTLLVERQYQEAVESHGQIEGALLLLKAGDMGLPTNTIDAILSGKYNPLAPRIKAKRDKRSPFDPTHTVLRPGRRWALELTSIDNIFVLSNGLFVAGSDDNGSEKSLTYVGFKSNPEATMADLPMDQLLHQVVDSNIVTAVNWGPDKLWTGNMDGEVRAWDMATGLPIGDELDTGAKIDAVATAPDGSGLAAASADGSLNVWDLKTGDSYQLGVPDAGRDTSLRFAWNLAWSPKNDRFAVGFADGHVQVFARNPWQPVGPPQTHATNVFCVDWHPDGTRFISASKSSDKIEAWDGTTGASLGALITNHDETAFAFALWVDKHRIATADESGRIELWNAESGASERLLLNTSNTFLNLLWSAPSNSLIAISRDNIAWSIPLDPVATNLETGKINSNPGQVALSPDGRIIAANSLRSLKRVIFLEPGTWRPLSDSGLAGQSMAQIDGLVLAADPAHRDRFAVADSSVTNPYLAVFDPGTGQMTNLFSPATNRDGGDAIAPPVVLPPVALPIKSLAFSDDGGLVAAGCGDNVLKVYQVAADGSLKDGYITTNDAGYSTTTDHVCFAAGTNKVLLSSAYRTYAFDPVTNGWSSDYLNDGTNSLDWPFATSMGGYTVLKNSDLQEVSYVTALAYSPSGAWVAFGCTDGRVGVRIAHEGFQQTETLLAHDGAVNCITPAPDGSGFFSGGSDGRICYFQVTDMPLEMQTLGTNYGQLRSETGVELSDLLDPSTSLPKALAARDPPRFDLSSAGYWRSLDLDFSAARRVIDLARTKLTNGPPVPLADINITNMYGSMARFYEKYHGHAPDQSCLQQAALAYNLLECLHGSASVTNLPALIDPLTIDPLTPPERLRVLLLTEPRWAKELSTNDQAVFQGCLAEGYGARIRQESGDDMNSAAALTASGSEDKRDFCDCIKTAVDQGLDWSNLDLNIDDVLQAPSLDGFVCKIAPPPYLLGRARLYARDLSGADRARQFFDAFHLRGEFVDSDDANTYANLLSRGGRFDDAEEINHEAESLAKTDSDKSDVLDGHAVILEQKLSSLPDGQKIDETTRGQIENQIQLLEKQATGLDPTISSRWIDRARAQGDTGAGLTASVRDLSHAIELLDPVTSSNLIGSLQVEIAGHLIALNNDNDSVEHYLAPARDNIDSASDAITYWNTISDHFKDETQMEQSFKFVARFISTNSDLNDTNVSWLLSRRGVQFRNAYRFREALADVEASVQRGYDIDWSLSDVAEDYHLLGDYERAEMTFNQCQTNYPTDAWSFAMHARLAMDQGRPEAAFNYASNALSLVTNTWIFDYVDACAFCGNWTAGFDVLNDQIASQPTNAALYLSKAWLYLRQAGWNTNRSRVLPSDVTNLLEIADSLNQTNNVLGWSDRGYLLCLLGRTSEAETLYQNRLKNWPDDPETWVNLAAIRADKKDPGGSLIVLARLCEAASRQFYDAGRLKRDLLLGDLSGNPRFVEFLDLLKLTPKGPAERDSQLAQFTQRLLDDLPASPAASPVREGLQAAIIRFNRRVANPQDSYPPVYLVATGAQNSSALQP